MKISRYISTVFIGIMISMPTFAADNSKIKWKSITPPKSSGMIYILIRPTMSWNDTFDSGGNPFNKVKYAVKWGSKEWNNTGYWDGEIMRTNLLNCLQLQLAHWDDSQIPITVGSNYPIVDSWQGAQNDKRIKNNCSATRIVKW